MKRKGILILMIMLILILNVNNIINLERNQSTSKNVVLINQSPNIGHLEPQIQSETEKQDQGSNIQQSINKISQKDDFEIVIPWGLTHDRGKIIRSMITNHSTLGDKYNYIFTQVGGNPADRDLLKARFLAGNYPNLIICTNDWYTEFAQYGIWENFSDLIASWSTTHPTWVNDIPDGWWNVLDFENGDGSGSNIFALPSFGQTVLLYINKDHFNNASINWNTSLTTVAEILTAAETLAADGWTPFAMVGDGSSDTTYMNYMLGSTDNYISSRYAVPIPATVYPFDTPLPSNIVGGGGVNGSLSVEGFAAYLKMKGEGWVQKTVDISSGPVANSFFGNGSASMVFCGPWGPNIFENEAQTAGINLNYTVVDMPTCSDGVRSTIIGGGITMVPKTITNVTMKADAMTLAEWLLEDENQMKTVENWLDHTWQIPVRESLKNNPWFSDFPNRSNFITHIDSQSYAYPWGKQHPSWMSIHDNVMKSGYYNALLGITWNGTYTDQDYTDFAQNALDAMALDIETNYLPYTSGSTISIMGDAGFSGFPGFGTIESPYLIKGFNITSSSGTLIEIKDTRAYFIITNCILNGLTTADDGIYFANVTHGTIVNNIVCNTSSDGITLGDPSSSNKNVVANNTVYGNTHHGIRVASSEHNVIEGNTVYNNTIMGINLGSSNNNIVCNNTVYDNGLKGIYLLESNNNTITKNTVHDNAEDGIWIGDENNNNNISSNTIYDNSGSGVSIGSSKNCTIVKNFISGNDGDGLHLSSVTHGTAENNTIFQNKGTGISLEFASTSYNKIIHNTIYDNGIGIDNGGNNNTISNNTVYRCDSNGIWLNIGTQNNTVTDNTIYDNDIGGGGHSGIELEESHNNTISYNVNYNNPRGIGLWSAHHNTIANNTVYNNVGNGIHLESSDLNSINNNTVNNNAGDGIHLESSDFNNIYNNTVHNSGFAEINLRLSSNNTVSSNTVRDNRNAAGIYVVKNDYNNTISTNNVYNNSHGIRLEAEADMNWIMNNNVYDNGAGIYLEFARNNTIISNIVRENDVGITIVNGDELGNSWYNTISQNLIYNNQGYGMILLTWSGNNQIKNNDFSENNAGESQASDSGSYNVFSSNYWSDWIGTGSYAIHGSVGNEDASPSVNPHHLSAPVITAPTTTTTTLKDSITIQWNAAVDVYSHSFTYSIFYSTDSGATWVELASGLSTLSHTWDVTSLYDGTSVLLKVVAIDSIGFQSYSISTKEYVIDNPELTHTPSTTSASTTSTISPTTTTEPTLTVSTPGITAIILLLAITILGLKRKRRT